MASSNANASELFNRQLDSQKIEALKKRVEELKGENLVMKQSQEKTENDSHEFVRYFQRELERKDDVITSLTEQAATEKVKYEMEIQSLKDKYDETTTRLTQSSKEKQTEMSSRIKGLQEDLTKLEIFREQKDRLEHEVESLQAKYDKDMAEQARKFAQWERKALEDKAKIQKETERRIEKIKLQSKEEARNGLDADTRKIITDNKRVVEELRFQVQTTHELQEEKKRLQKANSELTLNISLLRDKEQEYSIRGQRQSKEIKQLQMKVKNLERSLSQVVHEFEREKDATDMKNQRQLEDQSIDASGLRRLLQLKNKELKQISEYAQTILDQRTDTEQFFLDALESVKKEIRKERQEAYNELLEKERVEKKQGFNRRTKFPHLKRNLASTTKASKLPKTPSEKVDIRDLTWEDRERVLRLLFSKINSAQGFIGQPNKKATADQADINLEYDGSRVFATQPASIHQMQEPPVVPIHSTSSRHS